MAAVDEMILVIPGDPRELNRNAILDAIKRQLWGWFDANLHDAVLGPEIVGKICTYAQEWVGENQDFVVLRRRVLWIQVTIRARDILPFLTTLCKMMASRVVVEVRDLKGLFERLLGPHPIS